MMNETKLTNLIKENKGLICSIINKYTKYYEFDDLYQVSVIGIIKAYQNFDETRDVKITTYMYKHILGEVLAFVKKSNLLTSSREYYRLYKKILESRTILTQKLMKEPTLKELSLFLEIDEDLIRNVLKCQEKVKSLDEVIIEDGKKLTLLDKIDGHYQSEDQYLENISLKEVLNTLTEEEYKLINLRYFEDKTQSEIAASLGTNQVQISRNEKKILKKLKNNLCKSL